MTQSFSWEFGGLKWGHENLFCKIHCHKTIFNRIFKWIKKSKFHSGLFEITIYSSLWSTLLRYKGMVLHWIWIVSIANVSLKWGKKLPERYAQVTVYVIVFSIERCLSVKDLLWILFAIYELYYYKNSLKNSAEKHVSCFIGYQNSSTLPKLLSFIDCWLHERNISKQPLTNPSN